MPSHDQLAAEHATLKEACAALLELVRSDTPDPHALAGLRWRMTRVLIEHLAKEDQLLYPALARSPDLSTRQLAVRFQQEMGSLRDDYGRYIARWTVDAIDADWDGFRADSRALVAALNRRIRREDTELYPRRVH